MKNILKGMIETMNAVKPPRMTALRQLHDVENGDPFNILIGTILSARTKDENTTKVAGKLFAKYKSVKALANAKVRDVEKIIRSIGFYHVKAKRIIEVASIINTKFNGKVPDDLDTLITLPGVGRKTANVVLGNAYGIMDGIAVDTHMIRINQKLGFTAHSDPVKIEKDLMEIIPKKDWFGYTYRIIEYGRNVCPARHKKCDCEIYKIR